MEKANTLFSACIALLIGSILLTSCSKSVDLTLPNIMQLNALQSTGDTIVLKMVGSVVYDGQNYTPESITWVINDQNGNSVTPTTVNFDIVKFVPESTGQFTISALVVYNGNKKVTVLKQIAINSSVAFFQKKLIGTWVGSAHNYYGTNWTYTFEIDSSNGHYFAMLTSGNIPCVTWYGEGNDNIHSPLKKLVINNVVNEKATGYLYVYYGGSPATEYSLPYDVKELHFSNNYTKLDFDFFPENQHYTYSMTKQ